MTVTWSAQELARIDSAVELLIAVRRADGTLRSWLPIWVVCANEQVYVRTWHRRETGWFGHVLNSRRARVRVPRLESDVTVTDVGEATADLCARVDAAYRNKYGLGGAETMVTPAAAATTLQLTPERGH